MPVTATSTSPKTPKVGEDTMTSVPGTSGKSKILASKSENYLSKHSPVDD